MEDNQAKVPAEVFELKKEKDSLKAQCDILQAEVLQLKSSGQNTDTLNAELTSAKNELAESRNSISDKDDKIEELEVKLDKHREAREQLLEQYAKEQRTNNRLIAEKKTFEDQSEKIKDLDNQLANLAISHQGDRDWETK